MLAGRPAEIIRHLELPITPDRDLLERFARERDQFAFAELVKRHSAIVLAVCRRVTGHHQDAEDAFQAVFLILARKALSIRKPEVLGSWLHGVAQRVAQTARRSSHRRNAREVLVRSVPDRPDPRAEAIEEPCHILDEELANLPAWYRDAIILCDLQGLSRGEAATLLGVPEGTLSSRLANGRKKLAARLAKRGLVFSMVAMSTTLSVSRSAVASTELLAKTCGLVGDLLAGTEIPRPLSRLIEGGMAVRKAFVFSLLATAVAVTGVVFATQLGGQAPVADPPGKTPVTAKPTPGEQASDEAKPNDASFKLTLRPRLRKAVDMIGPEIAYSLVWNEQGTQLAVGGAVVGGQKSHAMICVVPVDSLELYTFYAPSDNSLIGFTADGKSVLTEIHQPRLVSGFHKLEIWSTSKPDKEAEKESKEPGVATMPYPGPGYVRESKPIRSIDLDSFTQGYAFSPDGKTFRAVIVERDPGKPEHTSLEVEEVDVATGSTLKSLLKLSAQTDTLSQALSRDGKRIAFCNKRDSLVVYDVDRGSKLATISLKPAQPKLLGPRWSNSGNNGNEREKETPPRLSFSGDGQHLLASRGIGQITVFEAGSGKAMPELEGTANMLAIPNNAPFTREGRLLALVVGNFRHLPAPAPQGAIPIPPEDSTPTPWDQEGTYLIVWDTTTGKAIKRWTLDNRWTQDSQVMAAFNPSRPVLAVVEKNGDGMRLGLWDFQKESQPKK